MVLGPRVQESRVSGFPLSGFRVQKSSVQRLGPWVLKGV